MATFSLCTYFSTCVHTHMRTLIQNMLIHHTDTYSLSSPKELKKKKKHSQLTRWNQKSVRESGDGGSKGTWDLNLTPVSMAKIKKTGDNRCWWGCRERGTLLHYWWDCKLVQPLWKSVLRFFRKLDIVLPEDPAIPRLCIYPNDAPTYSKDTCSTMFIAALFIVAKSWKEPRCLSKEEWI